MNKNFKIIFSLFGIFALIYLCSSAFNYFYEPYVTDVVYKTNVNYTIDVEALAVRNEKIITSDKKGIKVYSVENGSKVAKNATVIEYFNDDESAALQKQIDLLSKRIERFSAINNQNGSYAADLDVVSANVTSNLFNLLNAVDENNIYDADELSDDFLYSMCQSGAITGKVTQIGEKISSLKKQLKELKSKEVSSNGYVNVKESGYFVNSVDGYENAVSFENVEEITVNDFNKIKPEKNTDNAVGKVVCESSWYLLAKVNSATSHELTEGKKVEVILPLSSTQTLEATVEKINHDSKSGDAIIILNCTNMNAELSAIRIKDVQIVIDDYTGLRVNKKAIRVKDKKQGVYVVIGSNVKFREINIIYSANDYVIVDSDNSGDQLKVYDDVIIKGKGLDEDG